MSQKPAVRRHRPKRPGHSSTDHATTAPRLAAQAPQAVAELLEGVSTAAAEESDSSHEELYEGACCAVVRTTFMLLAEARGILNPGSDGGVRHLHRMLRNPSSKHDVGGFAALRALWQAAGNHPDSLFAADRDPIAVFDQTPDNALLAALDLLTCLNGREIGFDALPAEHLGAVHEALIGIETSPEDSTALQASARRRLSGVHYTPEALARQVTSEALAPLLARLDASSSDAEQVLSLKVCDPAMGSGAFIVQVCEQLAKRLVVAWGNSPTCTPAASGPIGHADALRQIAAHCLYGVDRDLTTVHVARLVLWLTAEGDGDPSQFAHRTLRHGDSLVGVDGEQIRLFHWRNDPAARTVGFEAVDTAELLAAATLDQTRERGDLLVSAFFDSDNAKDRDIRRHVLADALLAGDTADSLTRVRKLRHETPPLAPFHWQIEFPEVFDRPDSGFDAIVTNPPFAGKNTLASANVDAYPAWLKMLHPDSHGNADLAAHFLRRGFALLRSNGTLGMIATNTICQGDTRISGLRWVCDNGGRVYSAHRRVSWPGDASVVASIIHIIKGPNGTSALLDGDQCDHINSFLMPAPNHPDPQRLAANLSLSFVGSYVHGKGFTFDDTDTSGKASTLADMHTLLEADPRNGELITPYIAGEEFNKHPAQQPHRYVINFRDWPLRREERPGWMAATPAQRQKMRRAVTVPADYPHPVAADYPDLLAVIEERVKPARSLLTRNAVGRHRATYWWQHTSGAPRVYEAIAGLPRVLVNVRVSPRVQFAFLDPSYTYSHALHVLALDSYAAFCVLQSQPHTLWAQQFGSSLKDDLRYNTSDCFETFPMPAHYEAIEALHSAGQRCYEFRAELMVSRGEGLTKTYNRFHSADTDNEVVRLRELHSEMDAAVLAAYGFELDDTTCRFHPAAHSRGGRHGWSLATVAAVIERLVELNMHRAAHTPPRQPQRHHRRSRQEAVPTLF